MIDQKTKPYMQRIIAKPIKRCSDWNNPILFKMEQTFTRSNGTLLSRLYERLTKASRRRQYGDEINLNRITVEGIERVYRQGVYDAFKALQEELS